MTPRAWPRSGDLYIQVSEAVCTGVVIATGGGEKEKKKGFWGWFKKIFK